MPALSPYYESQYEKWSTTAISAGLPPFRQGKHAEIQCLLPSHEKQTPVKHPNEQSNAPRALRYISIFLLRNNNAAVAGG